MLDILKQHKEWLDGTIKDKPSFIAMNIQDADLRGANLRGADLRGANLQDAVLQDAVLQDADLRGANLQYAVLRGADLQDADLQGADLQDADLQGADLRRANLQGANLQGANLDFSCLPLWRGGSHFKCSPSLIYQLIAHICTLTIIDGDEELELLLQHIRGVAVKSHRAFDLGLIKEENTKKQISND